MRGFKGAERFFVEGFRVFLERLLKGYFAGLFRAVFGSGFGF